MKASGLNEGYAPVAGGLGRFSHAVSRLQKSNCWALSAPTEERGKRQVRVLDEKRGEGDEEFCIEHGWFMRQLLEFGQNDREN